MKRTFCVHSDYGAPMTRFVQGMADKVGGPMLYLEAWTRGHEHPMSCIPVREFRGSSANGTGSSEGSLRYAADFVARAASSGYVVTAMGSSRIRYELSVRSHRGDRSDAEEATTSDTTPSGTTEIKLREVF